MLFRPSTFVLVLLVAWAFVTSALLSLLVLAGATHASARPATPGPRSLDGVAAYYSDKLEGEPTASGEPYRRRHLSAACWEFYGEVVTVKNHANGRSCTVRVNDRGPNRRLGRVIDLSEAAFAQLATSADIQRGTMLVSISSTISK